MIWIFILTGTVYTGILLFFFQGLVRKSRTSNNPAKPFVSVLVPARNEAKHIQNCLMSLLQQTYPSHLYEVLVIDDNSTDNTCQIVENFVKEKPQFRLLIYKNDGRHPTYKKQALKFGLKEAKGEIIFTIDADSIAQKNWLEITFHPDFEKNLFHKLQTLEFAGIVFCGVGSLKNGFPIICNGSNLSYRKKAFEDAGGYDGHEHLPSGDDDLLLQNIHNKTSWKVKYSLDRETINYTVPLNSVKGFLNQRSRWASKSLHYPSKLIFLILFVIYIFYSLTFLLFPLSMLGYLPLKLYILGILLKIFPEALIIHKGLQVLNRKDLFPLFLIAQIFQVPYILYAGFRGFFHKFSWKDS